jgi:hypothetical protein
MDVSAVEIAVLATAGFLGAVVYGLTGFGTALVTIPIATHVVSLPFALTLYVLTDLANAFRIGFEKPANAVRSEWTRMVPAILAGTAVGATLLFRLPRQAATLALGVFVIGFALYSLASRQESRRTVSPAWAYPAGFAGGLTSTLFGAGGPPYAMYLTHRGLSKEQYRATMGLATLASISLRFCAFLITGLLLEPKVWLYAAAVIPAGVAGLWAAGHLFRRISRNTLLRAIALMLLASGISLVIRATG